MREFGNTGEKDMDNADKYASAYDIQVAQRDKLNEIEKHTKNAARDAHIHAVGDLGTAGYAEAANASDNPGTVMNGNLQHIRNIDTNTANTATAAQKTATYTKQTAKYTKNTAKNTKKPC